MNAMEINLTITMTYLRKQKLCTRVTFRNRFFDNNRQRKTPTVIRYLLSSPKQPNTLWPKAPDFAIEHIFSVKLFATIILSGNSLNCIF